MAIICDTSGLFAAYDTANAHHAATVAALEAESGALLLPVVLLAEIDYLFNTRLGAISVTFARSLPAISPTSSCFRPMHRDREIEAVGSNWPA